MVADETGGQPSALRRRLQRLPRLGELPSAAGVAAARLLVRRGEAPGDGFVSDETPVIIAGMHRSGTSVVARLLEDGGAYVGGSWVDDNHESVYFSRANRAMLGEGPYLLYEYGWTAPKHDTFIAARRGYAERAARDIDAFFSERAGETVWGWKDPRNSLTLPVWLAVYPNARVLHVVRDGRSVALSLTERDGLDPAFGLALWGHYVERADRNLRTVPPERQRTVRFEDLSAEPARVIEEMFAFCGLAPEGSIEAIAGRVNPERATARLSDPAVALMGDHPLLERYGYT